MEMSQTFKPDIKAPLIQLGVFSALVAVFIDRILEGRMRFMLIMLALAALLLIRQWRARVVVDDAGIRVRRRVFAWAQITEVKVLPPKRLRGPVMLVVARLLPKVFAGRIGIKLNSRKNDSAKWVPLPRVSDQEGLLGLIRERLDESSGETGDALSAE
jgi:hypothetical protein